MIYDITDIINDTHQFSCLIEGGGGRHSLSWPQERPLPWEGGDASPPSPTRRFSLSFPFARQPLIHSPVLQRRRGFIRQAVWQRTVLLVHMLWINLKGRTVVFTWRCAFIHILLRMGMCVDSIMDPVSVCRYTVIYDSWRCVWGICNLSSTLRTRDNKVVYEYLIRRKKV